MKTYTVVLSTLLLVPVTADDVAAQARASRAASSRNAAAVAAPAPPAPKLMNNDDVLGMITAGLDEEVIVAAIRKAPGNAFDISATGLVALKKAGVSTGIVRVMIDPTAPPPTPPAAAAVVAAAPPPPAVSPYPTETGMYLRSGDSWKDVEPELVNWKTGGMLKFIASGGFASAHTNGTVSGPHSAYTVGMPGEFLMVTPEGTGITEYQLLDMWEKDSRREFRAWKFGGLGASSGTGESLREFKYEKVASRTYLVKVEGLKLGEFGFLAPGGGAPLSGSGAGKIYTFNIK
ncbi:hypothetical protein TBR22_A36350 [Luteitalea sp. TBR-22]|uniref:hypothetical protein n=1 Tax=Luteitalea sp. TBR-22 TaxID=2802971 RepID=UPI001AF0E04C|nr:hypothetical protein [Luteitalea sp. TBR-22]BCS34408.1 hypothetical protein TBR22_A36350 [Luteitalea sp. TBR-22]